MKISKRIKLVLEGIQPGLFPVWNSSLKKIQIFWKDPDTKITRYIHTVEDEDGNYCEIDERAILYLSRSVAWDCLKQYPHPSDTYKYMKSRKLNRKEKMRASLEADRQYTKKHYRREFKAALENARAGRFSDPPKPVEKKIVSYPAWAERHLSKPGLIVTT